MYANNNNNGGGKNIHTPLVSNTYLPSDAVQLQPYLSQPVNSNLQQQSPVHQQPQPPQYGISAPQQHSATQQTYYTSYPHQQIPNVNQNTQYITRATISTANPQYFQQPNTVLYTNPAVPVPVTATANPTNGVVREIFRSKICKGTCGTKRLSNEYPDALIGYVTPTEFVASAKKIEASIKPTITEEMLYFFLLIGSMVPLMIFIFDTEWIYFAIYGIIYALAIFYRFFFVRRNVIKRCNTVVAEENTTYAQPTRDQSWQFGQRTCYWRTQGFHIIISVPLTDSAAIQATNPAVAIPVYTPVSAASPQQYNIQQQQQPASYPVQTNYYAGVPQPEQQQAYPTV